MTSDLLFLDEPSTGMDPRSQIQVWELVRRIAAAGTTLLLITQYLEEADRSVERSVGSTASAAAMWITIRPMLGQK